jgi:3D (Asp-Asp-Asp) domain-containing protein
MLSLFLLACTVKSPALKSYPTLFKTNLNRSKSASSPLEAVSVSSIFSFSLPSPQDNRSKQLSLWATYYYTPVFPYSKREKHSILNLKGKAFGPRLSAKDWCNAALQGSFSISYPDGKLQTFNYAGLSKKKQVNCRPYHRFTKSGRIRFQEARGPYGDGATGIYSLIPLRSIAVDPKLIPYGSVVFIPKARGLKIKFSSGEVITHDGYFFANDTGGAIKKNHIDVYVGNEKHAELSTFVHSNSETEFTAFFVEDIAIQEVMKQAHIEIVTRGRVFAEQVQTTQQ